MDALDTFGRPLRDLRISVTDRCNFRCTYCMPKEVFGRDHRFLDRRELLTFEEITRVARTFVSLGTRKIRITGGEPLVRRDLERLVEQLAALDVELTLTTNASLLAAKAQTLADAGLNRITVSLDCPRRRHVPCAQRCRLPRRARARGDRRGGRRGAAGEGQRGREARRQRRPDRADGGVLQGSAAQTLRFIEFMDVGHTNGWRLDDVVPATEIVAILDAEFGVEAIDPSYRGEVAQRWRYRDGSGEVGVIASVTQPFCGDCTRARLSAEGKLFTCLFAVRGNDLRALVRGGASDDELAGRRARHLERANRPLFRAALGRDRGPAEDRDELHRRLAPAVGPGPERHFAPKTRAIVRWSTLSRPTDHRPRG